MKTEETKTAEIVPTHRVAITTRYQGPTDFKGYRVTASAGTAARKKQAQYIRDTFTPNFK